MGQEFIIKSQALEDKINQLLPSQGGFQAGVDLSASTTVIPIVDLTESAEGSNLRQDLQTSLSLTSVTSFDVNNTTSTLINTTGYFRVFGVAVLTNRAATTTCDFKLTDGTTTKTLFEILTPSVTTNLNTLVQNYDFVVFLEAGDSLTATTNDVKGRLSGVTRQIADINGNLVNP